MNIEQWPIDKPIPYARNARKLSPKAIDKIAASIKEFSFRQPIVVDREGVIIAGATGLQAAQKLGLETVTVHVAEILTPAQVRAYRLLDNRSHEESIWDEDLLGLELLDLKDCDIDLSLTGFDLGELERYMAGPEPVQGLTDEDAVPDVPDVPVSVPGDLWRLGDHRVLCGEATSATDAPHLMAGHVAPPVFCYLPLKLFYQRH